MASRAGTCAVTCTNRSPPEAAEQDASGLVLAGGDGGGGRFPQDVCSDEHRKVRQSVGVGLGRRAARLRAR